MKALRLPLLILSLHTLCSIPGNAQQNNLDVIAYYSGKDLNAIDSIAANKLTHIIFSFCHLKGNRLSVDNATDTAVIQKLVGLKTKNSHLKVMLSLGGWGGCEPCSDVFSSDAQRKAFATSVKELNQYFGTDGIDLDWEYPAIEGYPGHTYKMEDRENFTKLVQTLRKTLEKKTIISFAAGGFQKFIDQSIEWEKVMKEVDMVNLMTYDLVNGYSTITGHHTALYSTPQQIESTENAVDRLLKMGIPGNKIIIGAAFYGRVWEKVPSTNNGLYQQGTFKTSVEYKDFPKQFSPDKGFIEYWDTTAAAPYIYNAIQNLFVTYDNKQSMTLKTQYVKDKGLKGIMFWELTHDVYSNGLLDAIDEVKRK